VTNTLDINRFAGVLGLQQPEKTNKTDFDVLNDAPNSNAKLLRVNASIPSGGAWDYSYYDLLMTTAQNAGVKVMLLVTYSPSSLLPDLPTMPEDPGHVATYPRTPSTQDLWTAYAMNLISYVGRRYQGTLVAVEVYNEPNSHEFASAPDNQDISHAPVDPVAYTALLKKMYVAVKGENPTTLVITGGTAPSLSTGGALSPNDWYTQLHTSGAAPGSYFDDVGVHLYDGVDAPWSQQWSVIAPIWPSVQLWATEQGCRDTGTGCYRWKKNSDDPDIPWYVNGTSGSSGVGANIDAFRGKTQAGAWIEFTAYDRASSYPTFGDGSFDGYGLKFQSGTAKASFTEFASRA
jgi:hypothetical protein